MKSFKLSGIQAWTVGSAFLRCPHGASGVHDGVVKHELYCQTPWPTFLFSFAQSGGRIYNSAFRNKPPETMKEEIEILVAECHKSLILSVTCPSSA